MNWTCHQRSVSKQLGASGPALGDAPAGGDITPLELANLVLESALDKKAAEPAILEVGEAVGYTEYFVIVSARNPRQVRAIADSVRSELKTKHGVLPVGTEGLETGRWVLVDFDDVVLHVFHMETRAYYDLEGLWGDAPRLPVPEAESLSFVDEDDDDLDDREIPLFTVPS